MSLAPKITTVCGDIDPDQLGVTLIHEHLAFDGRCFCTGGAHADAAVTMDRLGDLRRNPMSIRDNLVVNDVEFLVEAVQLFKEYGGGTIVDVTPPEIGRDPVALREISERTGIHIIAGGTHYIKLTHSDSLQNESIEEIEERILGEIRSGIGASGVRPGILGEIGTSNPVYPSEIKVLKAAARAAVQTGLAITLHMEPTAYAALDVLDLIEEEGLDLSRVIVGHLDATVNREDAPEGDPISYISKIMKRGAYVAFDTFGEENWFSNGIVNDGRCFMLPSDEQRINALLKLISIGDIGKILISQDACIKTHHVKFGGFGYAYILKYIVPELISSGLSEREIDIIMKENPKNVLSII